MKIDTVCARLFLAFSLLVVCTSTFASEKSKLYKGQKFLALPVRVKGSSQLSNVPEEPSKLPNSLSQSQNKSIEPGGTPHSVSVSLSQSKGERHFHFSVDALASLADEGPAQSTTSHKTEQPRKHIIIVDDEADCQVKNESKKNEFDNGLIDVQEVIVQADESAALNNESLKDKSGTTQLSRCSLLHCLRACCGVRV